MIKVLFLSAWYPNREDAMFGLFVRKHAEAVSLYCEVQVLYVHADKNIRDFEYKIQTNKQLSELIVYYPSLSYFQKLVNYFRAYSKGLRFIRQNGFTPDIIHANILTRTAYIALLISVLKKLPYIISEHWSRYLPGRTGYQGFLRKSVTKLVIKNASAILPVSEILKQGMIQHGLTHKNYHLVGNVVENIFYAQNNEIRENFKRRFVHVSCFDEQAKNICGILRSFKEISLIRTDLELIIIGTGKDYKDVYNYYQSLSFPLEMVMFKGELNPDEVANWLRKSDCFVLFSNYETAGIVISESLATGIPVISSKVGIAPEIINKETGILIDCGDEAALKDAILFITEHPDFYDSRIIQAYAQKYRYSGIGNQITNIYQEILTHPKK